MGQALRHVVFKRQAESLSYDSSIHTQRSVAPRERDSRNGEERASIVPVRTTETADSLESIVKEFRS